MSRIGLDLAAQVHHVRVIVRSSASDAVRRPARPARSARTPGPGLAPALRQPELPGVSATASPRTVTAWRAGSITSSPTKRGFVACSGRAARRPHARRELARAERLHHVVVGAEVRPSRRSSSRSAR
jgi:hypothetical protein